MYFQWTNTEQNFSEQLKNRLSSLPVLRCADSCLLYKLLADASVAGAGAELTQTDEKVIRPVAFCSRKLIDAKRGYSTHEKSY